LNDFSALRLPWSGRDGALDRDVRATHKHDSRGLDLFLAGARGLGMSDLEYKQVGPMTIAHPIGSTLVR
jgi:hypothetical protein